ncbi:chromosome segregation protein SMC [[Phormidium] sp. ETS-05]|uniref:chromosome segregation protein SMC n=1 Tax=[Phormidium] sp. ETS-05 TaxID=222819 RepID=UPI0018EF2BD4|nr:chromosome segregation protein SMC [[Phormidium] sp. ETS-05]
MVHIKRLELKNFKSFGGTTVIPVLPGFTVVSGPNGSGKSNILDALLFCLGISTSKGMRAERLPDLVNQNQSNRRATVEASVTVTFDLSDSEPQPNHEPSEDGLKPNYEPGEEGLKPNYEPGGEGLKPNYEPGGEGLKPNYEPGEWSITRRLRVTRQGTYTSTYYMNGEPCTLFELHDRLNQLRVYPEGYNIVQQGDVTNIISMNAKERRLLIDELAGVAQFDRKIAQAKEKLDEVKERSERSRIVETELVREVNRLAKDRTKAQAYHSLRLELLEKQHLHTILEYHQLQQLQSQLLTHIEADQVLANSYENRIVTLSSEIGAASIHLSELSAQVKALGEDRLIALQSTLATQQANLAQQEMRLVELQTSGREIVGTIAQTEKQIKVNEEDLELLKLEQHLCDEKLAGLHISKQDAEEALERCREEVNTIAAEAGATLERQTQLHRQINQLQATREIASTDVGRLTERITSWRAKIASDRQYVADTEKLRETTDTQIQTREAEITAANQRAQELEQLVAATEDQRQTQQQTHKRLSEEFQQKQRRLDQLEAKAQAIQEATGGGATKVVLQAKLEGVLGLVSQLGRVRPEYQLALETAAGSRLTNIVVTDDAVAAAGIELLKQKRAGRATFLPLNKIKPPQFSFNDNLKQLPGFIDYAVNLIECAPEYSSLFTYVFGSTLVFENLETARQLLGKIRIVTLEGDILEAAGAMTGGSFSPGSRLHFGTADAAESAEVEELKSRLHSLQGMLVANTVAIEELSATLTKDSQSLMEVKQLCSALHLQQEQRRQERARLVALVQTTQEAIAKNESELQASLGELQTQEANILALDAQLNQWRAELAQLEASGKNSQWQSHMGKQRELEALSASWDGALAEANLRRQNLISNQERCQDKIREGRRRIEELHMQQLSTKEAVARIAELKEAAAEEIETTKAALQEVEGQLKEVKEARDAAEASDRTLRLERDKLQFQLQKLQETQQQRRSQLAELQDKLAAKLQEMAGWGDSETGGRGDQETIPPSPSLGEGVGGEGFSQETIPPLLPGRGGRGEALARRPFPPLPPWERG